MWMKPCDLSILQLFRFLLQQLEKRSFPAGILSSQHREGEHQSGDHTFAESYRVLSHRPEAFTW